LVVSARTLKPALIQRRYQSEEEEGRKEGAKTTHEGGKAQSFFVQRSTLACFSSLSSVPRLPLLFFQSGCGSISLAITICIPANSYSRESFLLLRH